MIIQFARSNDGKIHLESPLGDDRTLCGDAQEGDCEGVYESDQAPSDYAWETCEPQPLTCKTCLLIARVGSEYFNHKVQR